MDKIMAPIYSLMTKFSELIYSLGLPLGFATGILMVIAGVLLAFFGYKFKKITLFLIGALLGSSFGLFLGSLVGNENIYVTILLTLLFGLIGAFLIYYLYYV